MERKVSLIGPSTLMVSLPSKWCRKYNINKGDLIQIAEENAELIFSPKGTKPVDKKITIDITKLGRYTMRCLAAAYRRGYDEIRIEFKEPGLVSEIQKDIRDLIGFEIVQQGKDYCIVKNISSGLDKEFDQILKRVFHILISMTDTSLEAIKEGNLCVIKDTLSLEEANNKFTTFCRRLIIRQGCKNSQDAPLMYCIIEELEKIADEYKYLFLYILETSDKSKVSSEVLDVYKEVNQMLKDFYYVFYKFDLEKSLELSKKRKNIIKNIYPLFEKKSKKDARILHYLINILQMISNMSTVYLVIKL